MKQTTPIYLDFDLVEVAEPVKETILQVQDLHRELLVLRVNFGRLKAAVSTAVQPVAAVLVPAITEAVRHTTRLVTTLGQVIAGLLGVQAAQFKVQKTVVSTGKAAKRTVASFDQLNRLQGNTGGRSVTTQQVPVTVKPTLSPEAQQIVNRIKEIFAPLQQIDLAPLQWGFARLWEQAQKFADGAGQVLTELWQQVLVPFLGWVVEALIPVLSNLGAGTFKLLQVCLEDAADGFLQMLEDMKPLTEFVGKVVLTVFDQLRRVFADTRISAEQDGTALGELFRTIGDSAAFLWERLGPTLESLRQLFASTFQSIGKTVAVIMDSVLEAVGGAVELISGILTGDWSRIWNGLGQICKNAVNGVIGVLNVLLSGLTGALNGVFKLLNKVSIDVPDWVPGMGGETFGFHLKELKAPQIPYLAKGAVLPANQPFLAMVGDQKHGTNIEAPLSTIQEAVALTIEDFVQSNLAGHRATVEVLRQILEAVLGIHITDAELYRAVERYRGQRSVMLGTGR